MFNHIIIENFTSPSHQGQLRDADITLELGNPTCGDKVLVNINIDGDDMVTEARFRAWGCATSLAMSNVFCRFIEGRHLEDLSQLTPEQISLLLGELEPSQQHCLNMLHKLFGQLGEVQPA